MLVFIDESGDPGMKQKEGSSKFFTIVLIVFEDRDEGNACDKRIELLKEELGWNSKDEFHFKNNSDKVRKKFLETVTKYNFFYYGIIINKNPAKLYGEGFKDKKLFYKYACGLVFQNAQQKLIHSTVIIDQSGSQEFKKQLATYLKRKMNDDKCKVIKKVKMQKSSSNNLLQLADYVAGVINRTANKRKKNANEFHKIIAHREIYVQMWPR
jgi:hypothetical protein